ncbi:hypothetical protein [Nannocystis pusilla]|uniref:hypothetical protein n=1 Tax=Nannocystis pusilla TaxID=889268 RepID=UPI003B8234C4
MTYAAASAAVPDPKFRVTIGAASASCINAKYSKVAISSPAAGAWPGSTQRWK